MRPAILGLLLLGALTAGAWATDGDAPAPAAADIDRVLICKTVDDHNRPIDTTSVFIPSDSFFCSIHARKVAAGTPLAIKWYCCDKLVKSDRFVVNQDGEANLYFQVDAPDEAWVPGAYRAEVMVNDALAQTLPFTVSADPAAQVVAACLSRDVDHSTLEPVEPTVTYGPKDTFWCSLKLDCPQKGEDVGIKWLHGPTDVLQEVHTHTLVRTTHYLAFMLNPKKGAWAPGDYEAELLLQGQPVKTLSFKVQ